MIEKKVSCGNCRTGKVTGKSKSISRNSKTAVQFLAYWSYEAESITNRRITTMASLRCMIHVDWTTMLETEGQTNYRSNRFRPEIDFRSAFSVTFFEKKSKTRLPLRFRFDSSQSSEKNFLKKLLRPTQRPLTQTICKSCTT